MVSACSQEVSTTLEGVHVEPAAGAVGNLELMHSTIAEISRAAGFYSVDLDDATRTVEIKHEAAFLNQGVPRWESSRLGIAEAPWSLILSDPMPIEDYIEETRPIGQLTKMATVSQ